MPSYYCVFGEQCLTECSSALYCNSERNRLHAKASRERKRQFFQALEESVQSLKEENERLLQILGLQGNFDRKMVVQRQEEIQATSTEIFVRCLQKPGNRVLHDEELSNLRDHLSS